jgi:hypothetical protein
MSAMTDYLEEQVLHDIFDNTVYLGLALSGAFADDSYATEASGQAYVRQELVSGEFTIADAGGGQWQAINANAISFPEATGDYANPVVGWGLFDAVSGDNFLIHSTSQSKPVVSGNVVYIEAGELVIEAQ